MPPAYKSFFRRWLMDTLAVLVASKLVSGIHCDSFTTLLVASLLLGFFNAFLKPLLWLLSLPLLILTLGLFTLVINAMLLVLVGALVANFHVTSFGAAFWGGLVISLVSFGLNSMLGPDPWKNSRKRASPKSNQGPVIDV